MYLLYLDFLRGHDIIKDFITVCCMALSCHRQEKVRFSFVATLKVATRKNFNPRDYLTGSRSRFKMY